MKFSFTVIEYIMEKDKISKTIEHTGFTNFREAREFIKTHRGLHKAFQLMIKEEVK